MMWEILILTDHLMLNNNNSNSNNILNNNNTNDRELIKSLVTMK